MLLLPLVLLAAAAGAVYWLVWTLPFGKNQQDIGRLSHLAGWFDPAMDQHFDRLLVGGWSPRSIFENLKNIASEWVRLDPQRAGKLNALLILIFLVLIIMGFA